LIKVNTYASSKGAGDMPGTKKWGYASSKAKGSKGDGNMQAAEPH